MMFVTQISNDYYIIIYRANMRRRQVTSVRMRITAIEYTQRATQHKADSLWDYSYTLTNNTSSLERQS